MAHYGDPIGQIVKDRFKSFLSDYKEEVSMGDSSQGDLDPGLEVYKRQIAKMREVNLTVMIVDYSHLTAFDAPLAASVAEEFIRFEPYIKLALQELIKEVAEDFLYEENVAEPRDFYVAFFNMPATIRVRELKTGTLGSLVTICGTVTRTSEVRPELLYGRFACTECGAMSPPIEQQFKFTEPAACSNRDCLNRGSWSLDTSSSRFVDWQSVRVQENADEIPAGSLPRTITVILRHNAVEKAKAGDKCLFTGTLVVTPDVSALYKAGTLPTASRGGGGRGGGPGGGEGVGGMKALGVRDLVYTTAFLAQTVARGTNPLNAALDASEEDVPPEEEAARSLTAEDKANFESMARDPAIYSRLVGSMAPTIRGHEDVKKGLLLMFLGGVHKTTAEGTNLRGDINVCIVGDPSTAKSQFLKYAVKFVPRGVYTSGKASSAAGLTASVVKDPDTGEFAIEAGALMLADSGVCCIDEFDKMDPKDQVAIHEAMEQQTISITKAGIQATLNARTSILAAANPLFGRYDRTKTLRQNVQISAPIMSRFDLFFVVLDEADSAMDALIASHVVKVHQKRGEALAQASVYSMAQLQGYVRYARTFKPVMTLQAQELIIRSYISLRGSDSQGTARAAYRITVRQLEALVRLSEAVARLHLDPFVRTHYVLEAHALLKKSLVHADSASAAVEFEGEGEDGEGGPQDARPQDWTHLTEEERARLEALESAAEEGGGGRGEEGEGGGGGGTYGTGGGESTQAWMGDGGGGGSGSGSGSGSGAAPPSPSRPPKAPAKVSLSTADFERIAKALAFRLREVEDGANQRMGEEGMRGEDVVAPTSLEKAVTIGELIMWYLEEVVAKRGGGDVAAVLAERKTVKLVIKHLLKADKDQPTLLYAEQYEGADVEFEDKKVLLNPDSPFAPQY